MATGEIKWFGTGASLGFVPVEEHVFLTRAPMKGAKLVRQTKEGSFVEIELNPSGFLGGDLRGADFFEELKMVPGKVFERERSEISGEWRWFISLPKADGSASSEVEAEHISEAFDLANFGIERSAIGLERPISEYGVHVIPLHLGRGLIASIYVNVARSPEHARQQESDFLKKGAQVSFRIETHYPYLEKSSQPKAQLSSDADETDFWLSANIKSLSAEAKEMSKRLPESAAYVASICSRIL